MQIPLKGSQPVLRGLSSAPAGSAPLGGGTELLPFLLPFSLAVSSRLSPAKGRALKNT